MATIDSIDEQLIQLLGEDALQSNEALARRLKISNSTVRRRIKRLIQCEVLRIAGLIDPNKAFVDINKKV